MLQKSNVKNPDLCSLEWISWGWIKIGDTTLSVLSTFSALVWFQALKAHILSWWKADVPLCDPFDASKVCLGDQAGWKQRSADGHVLMSELCTLSIQTITPVSTCLCLPSSVTFDNLDSDSGFYLGVQYFNWRAKNFPQVIFAVSQRKHFFGPGKRYWSLTLCLF